MSLTKKIVTTCVLICVVMTLQSCGAKRSPIEQISANLKNTPEYSIILEDMEIRGSVFKQYYHKYKVIIKDNIQYTGFTRVSEPYYRNNENYLGMSLLSKTEDGYIKTPSPPGYQYIGDSRYGEWKQDRSGNSFWAFYGQYMFMSHMFGMVNRPVYRSDYSAYTDYRKKNRPYYGSKNQYGTNGTVTKQTHKSFFQRKMARQKMAKQSFSQKVKQRAGRSQSPFRGRGGGFGK
ncbi:ABC-type proline/glycine betaine transport systems, periplasmic components [Candidatus Scalindua japonica]|uniref:ABC-type proline/glycine betaine transport systems, periplasmic components n=1 Tax=Candidatus Scalindua japonica TaxID=1284222 RepID=A0A286TUZ3_9BACT|nr:hypothetical protein [Candidatus Scalindua japonica]GAX59712.1 ABC-type proline/glycine betaine transport systems, periplasmic components [Candidatus Scalindua japonica]